MSEITDKSLFEFKAYKPYIKSRLGPKGTRRGGRSALANHLNCQSTFVSQVLNGEANFSLEQAEKMNAFFSHDQDESDAFLYLVLMERAGTKDLNKHFENKFNELVKKRVNIKRRLLLTETLSPEIQAKYYSVWYYSAIHQLLSIPQFQSKEAITDYLKLPMSKISRAIEFLQQHGLVEERDGKYAFGARHIHLDETSDNTIKHHINWRLEAINSLQYMGERNDLHYTVVYTLSKEDAFHLRDQFIALIKKNLEVIKPSPEEVFYCNVIDFFEVKK